MSFVSYSPIWSLLKGKGSVNKKIKMKREIELSIVHYSEFLSNISNSWKYEVKMGQMIWPNY